MSEMIPYPSSTVWYIQASSKGEIGQGSGVGIRLRKKGQPGTEETFILTCAHVIRRLGSTPQQLGPQHENIWVAPAGYGYDPIKGIPVKLETAVKPLTTYAGSHFYDQPIADVENADWALLSFDDRAWRNCQDKKLIAGNWINQELAAGNECVISGYPEGHKGFSGYVNGNDNNVRPKPGYNLQKVEKTANGLVTFDGTGSRAGMSGGGVFLKEGKNYSLCGLHRARYDERLQLKAVSFKSILLRLEELGYEPVALRSEDSTVMSDWFLDTVREEHFVLQKEVFEQISNHFVKSAAVVLTGIGGVGKSTVARRFGCDNKCDYDKLLYVNVSLDSSIQAGLAAFVGNEISSSECDCDPSASELRRKEVVERWLRNNSNWLLVIDGADTIQSRDAVCVFVRKFGENRRFLITSRLDQSFWSTPTTPIALRGLSESETAQFILDATPRRTKSLQDDDASAAEFSRLLGGLPLALKIVANWIDGQAKPLDECLRFYRERNQSVRGWGMHGIRDDWHRTLATAWDTSWETLADSAKVLLEVLSWCASTELDRRVVIQLENLDCLASSGLDVGVALKALKRCSFAFEANETKAISVHSLVQEFTRLRAQHDSPDHLSETFRLAVGMLAKSFPANSRYVSEWPLCRRLRPHVESVLSHLPKFPNPGPLSRLLTSYGTYLTAIGEMKVAEPLLREALARREQEFGPNSSEVAETLSRLAELLRDTSRNRDAAQLYLRAWSIQSDKFGADSPQAHEQQLQIYQFAKYWGVDDESGLAKQCNWMPILERTLIALEQAHGRESHEVAVTLMCLGQELIDLKRPAEAEKQIRESLKTILKLFPDDLQRVSVLTSLLASAIEEQKRGAEALDLRREVLEVTRKVYDTLHPQYAVAAAKLAKALETLEPEEAERLYASATETLAKFSGDNAHWSGATKNVIDNYLMFRMNQGEKSAEELLQSLPAALFEVEAFRNLPKLEPQLVECLKRCQNRDTAIQEIADSPDLAPFLPEAAVILHQSATEVLRHVAEARASSDAVSQHQLDDIFCQNRFDLRRALDILEKTVEIDDPRTLACRADWWKYSQWSPKSFQVELERQLKKGSLGVRAAARRIRLAWQHERLDCLKDMRTKSVVLVHFPLLATYSLEVAAEYFCALSMVHIASGEMKEAEGCLWESIRRFSKSWSKDHKVSYFCQLAFVLLRIVREGMIGFDPTKLYFDLLSQTQNQGFCEHFWNRSSTE
ncbi:hypothetical protein Psta_4463 [Pirellula staleyi DSM 6068]|uniref:NB-ARC domain-containing protein n=1 Tax=Pirellula staleyi (strain ATCC 27377 / DSM 6068 / ICPB 4128) TaxID=530564 RepID=D2R622_PIRSD|nr:tetratricopeptide repeat protein [Pirellula staleyi]ADB19107.1 hypothetical protein Psta_4463 [Pirellula staleyi DSM 6068]